MKKSKKNNKKTGAKPVKRVLDYNAKANTAVQMPPAPEAAAHEPRFPFKTATPVASPGAVETAKSAESRWASCSLNKPTSQLDKNAFWARYQVCCGLDAESFRFLSQAVWSGSAMLWVSRMVSTTRRPQ